MDESLIHEIETEDAAEYESSESECRTLTYPLSCPARSFFPALLISHDTANVSDNNNNFLSLTIFLLTFAEAMPFT